MSTPIAETTNAADVLAFQWNWRLAQQAFARIVARNVSVPAMVIEQARRSLSALSADERPAFERWIAMQLLDPDEISVARRIRHLGKIDALLAAGVRRQLPRITAELLTDGAMAVAA